MSICHALYSSRTAVHMDFLWLWCGISQESCWADKLANRSLKFQVHECVHLLRKLVGKVLENSSAESTDHGGNSLFMVYPSLLEIKQLVLSDFGSAGLMLNTATSATNLLYKQGFVKSLWYKRRNIWSYVRHEFAVSAWKKFKEWKDNSCDEHPI